MKLQNVINNYRLLGLYVHILPSLWCSVLNFNCLLVSSDSDGDNSGAIIGAVVGGIVGMILITLLLLMMLLCYYKQCKKKTKSGMFTCT